MPRRETPAPPKLRTFHLPGLTPGAPSVLRAHGTYEALSFSGDDLTGMDLTDVRFTGCVVDELDLTGAAVQRVSFDDTEVGTLDVSGATPEDVDLRAVDLPEITGPAHLRGATINDFQLQQPAPAAQLGIDVEG
jgi:hypothetical protein